jgi:hypothetical protein
MPPPQFTLKQLEQDNLPWFTKVNKAYCTKTTPIPTGTYQKLTACMGGHYNNAFAKLEYHAKTSAQLLV